MSVRMRHTSSHTKNRRSHHALTDGAIVKDKETGNLRLPHRLDEATGMYRGKQSEAVKGEKKEKAKGRAEAKSASAPGHEHLPSEDKKGGEKGASGIMGRLMGSRARARSGMGGGA